jgi:hypothetical protein
MCWTVLHTWRQPLPCCLLITARESLLLLLLPLQVIKDARSRLAAYGPKAVAFEFAQVGAAGILHYSAVQPLHTF